MPAVWLLLAALLFGPVLWADTSANREALSYSGASIVNAADNQPGPLAPNAIATIYGTGLAYTTKAITPQDIRGGMLPTVLPGTGVRVLVGNVPASIYFVSPTQINFLVPSSLLPGTATVQVALDSLAGPAVTVQIVATTPALFQLDQQNAIATRADGSVVTPDNPARSGEYVVLYATGLGQTTPPVGVGEVPAGAAQIKQLSDLKVSLGGVAVDARQIVYAGVSPGFGGLYQINLKLPDSLNENPEIRVGLLDQASPAGLRLPIRP
ncbi:MAG: hypothetical protein ACR2NN_23875 [Bryobacteraceae bacterium]